MREPTKVGGLSLVLFVLAGCATGTGGEAIVGRPGSPMWFNTASVETQRAHFQSVCGAYGFSPGTQEMASCIADEARSARSISEQRKAAVLASEPSYSTTTTCIPWGMGVRCTEG